MRTNSKKIIPSLLEPVDCPKIHPAMKEFLGYCLFKLSLQIRSRMEKDLAQFEMVAPQAAILAMISLIGPMTQVELGQLTGIDKATMVRLLDGLEKNEFLKRVNHAQDRRAKVLVITKQGEKVLVQIRKIRNEAENVVLTPLSLKEQELLRGLVAKLILHG